MGKILSVLFITIVLSGCNLLVYPVLDTIQENTVCGKTLYDGDFPEMKTIKEVSDYVNTIMKYKSTSLFPEICTIEQAIDRGYGDCNMYVLVFMDIAYYALGLKFDFASVDTGNSIQKSIENGGIPNHAVVSLDDQLYSAYDGDLIDDYAPLYIYSFDEVFK